MEVITELTPCDNTIVNFINTLVRDYAVSHPEMFTAETKDLKQLKYIWRTSKCLISK